MGCDKGLAEKYPHQQCFNPRIPYGMRLTPEQKAFYEYGFQSTHPVWDATSVVRVGYGFQTVSIHASRMGCDMNVADSTPYMNVLIHASRMGCDKVINKGITDYYSFNPRIPYGMRLYKAGNDSDIERFQSTHPVWDATPAWSASPRARKVSIHASRMGCDDTQCHGRGRGPGFNPRIPYGMRPGIPASASAGDGFQSTHPVWDATIGKAQSGLSDDVSIHASRMGCDGLEVNS